MTLSVKQQYDEQGYVIIPQLIALEDWKNLEAACKQAVDRTRKGDWPYRRTVGKQFPPYGQDDPDSWGVQHVMHPELGEPAFAKWYTSEKVLGVVEQLLECEIQDLQMELFNLLINPEAHDFALRWHRDDVPENASTEEEIKALDVWHFGVQWNTAIYRDACLYIVPGSHLVPRTQEQRIHSSGQIPKDPLAMPGAVQVVLEPGETVFYNSNILHCAAYSSQNKRATLHACMGNSQGGSSRARNILQHGLEWMKTPAFKASLPDNVGVGMLDKLIEMYDSSASEDVAYSLKN
ncbi:hypothetical protein CPB83DRAFT_621792 [Crepidotus variabilis]|uniref:Phytanoyl-CoA dioxygenase n=1 Tax=Crepidotus variabilis TaxID=179855 RepID=A0A9P6JKW3_9AGAR|nr:hypothetical protein CPB83DRAFT_621792 [Crepidotus variabilis]